jgi:hypothetical protein
MNRGANDFISPELRKFYLIGNGIAVAVAILAGFVNLAVGPRNLLIFAVAPFQIVFSLTLWFFGNEAFRAFQQHKNDPPPFWVRMARSEAVLKKWKQMKPSIGLFVFTPLFFLVVSISVLCASIIGNVKPR